MDESSKPYHAVALTLLFGLLYFANLQQPGLLDADEGFYAEAARTMFHSGDYVVPVVNGEPFFEKPPFLYWTQVLGFHIFGVGPVGVRFFNSLAALGLVLAVYFFSRRPLGLRGAFVAALILGTSFEFIGLARAAFVDMWLVFWLNLCLFSFYNATERAREDGGGLAWFLAACLCSGMAMLTKGAIGVLLPGAAAFLHLVVRRQFPLIRRVSWLLPGFLILFAVGFSWYIFLGLSHPDGFAFMKDLFLKHHVDRFLNPMQGHRGPIFYYLIVIAAGFLPWSPFLLLAFTRGRLRGDEPRVHFLQLMLFFSAVTFTLFSVAATKLPNYIAPLLPTLALLLANLWETQRKSQAWGRGWSAAVGICVGSLFLLAIAMLALPWVLEKLPAMLTALPGSRGEKVLRVPGLFEPWELGVMPYSVALVLTLGGAFTIYAYRKRSLDGISWSLAGTVSGIVVLAAFVALPLFDSQFTRPLRQAARRAGALAVPEKKVVLFGIKHAPSIVFYGAHPTRFVKRYDEKGIAALFGGPEPEVGITVKGYVDRLQAKGRAEILDEYKGYVVFRCDPAGQ